MGEMQKNIVFHVGTIKTASTYIQKFLFECKDQLSVFDIDYILLSPPRLDLPRYANADFIIDNDFDVQHVKDAITASPCRNIIFSEEGLMGRPESIMSAAFADCSRTAVMYVRPPVDLVAAWAAENSRPYNFEYIRRAEQAPSEEEGVLAITEVNSTSLGALSGIEYCSFTYGQLIDGFLNAAEADETLRLAVRQYGRNEFMGGNILVDFFHAAGLGDKLDYGLLEVIERYDAGPANESWCRKYCDVSAKTARLVQQFALEEIFGEALVDVVFERCASGDDRTVIETLSDVEMETVVGSLRGSYQRLAPKGYKLASDLQAMLPAIYGNGRRTYQPVDDDEITRAVIEFLEDGGRILPDGTELAGSRTDPLYKHFEMQSVSALPDEKEVGTNQSSELSKDLVMGDGVSVKPNGGSMRKLRDLRPTAEDFDLSKQKEESPDIVGNDFWDIAAAVWDYTELPIAALHNLYCSARYLVAAEIEGAFIECGVYLGGSIMAAELVLARHEGTSRPVYALDTFSGFVARNAELDVDQVTGTVECVPQEGLDYSEGSFANMRSVGYSGLRIVKGDVLQTIPTLEVDSIALLRLDTDTYETTKFELESLYDRVVRGGVVIVDDYGYTVGCKKAVDDFLATRAPVLMQRINKNVRCWIKP